MTKLLLSTASALVLVLGLSGAAMAGNNGNDKDVGNADNAGKPIKVTGCHNTSSETNPTVTITVALTQGTFNGHGVNHGDSVGECEGDQEPG